MRKDGTHNCAAPVDITKAMNSIGFYTSAQIADGLADVQQSTLSTWGKRERVRTKNVDTWRFYNLDDVKKHVKGLPERRKAMQEQMCKAPKFELETELKNNQKILLEFGRLLEMVIDAQLKMSKELAFLSREKSEKEGLL